MEIHQDVIPRPQGEEVRVLSSLASVVHVGQEAEPKSHPKDDEGQGSRFGAAFT